MVSALLESLDKINEYTEKIVGCAFRVSNILEPGFLEKVYESALVLELKKAGLKIDDRSLSKSILRK